MAEALQDGDSKRHITRYGIHIPPSDNRLTEHLIFSLRSTTSLHRINSDAGRNKFIDIV
jgi:hypothetical protein